MIVVGDKAIGVDSGRFQIPGEMVAAALRNYNIQAGSQTIFAIRIVSMIHYLLTISKFMCYIRYLVTLLHPKVQW